MSLQSIAENIWFLVIRDMEDPNIYMCKSGALWKLESIKEVLAKAEPREGGRMLMGPTTHLFCWKKIAGVNTLTDVPVRVVSKQPFGRLLLDSQDIFD